MTKRNIIKIDEEKCTGCGLYIPNSPEGAITTEEREGELYDEKRTMENIVKAGKNTIIGYLKHLKNHKETGYLKEGILDTKTKELVAIGTAITARCKYCIAIHVEKALKAGATKEEILEVATVAILMGGGPAMTYIVEVKKALDEFLS